MHKLIALYKQPADPKAFDKAYFGTHIPLVEKVPGLVRTELTRVNHTMRGDGFYLVGVLYFKDQEALQKGMSSPEMLAAGENLDSFAKGQYVLMFGEDAA